MNSLIAVHGSFILCGGNRREAAKSFWSVTSQ